MLVLNNICKYYYVGGGKICALNGVNLRIHEGEFLAIVGQSGSGKSTLMNLLGCLDRPNSGEYYFKGKSVLQMNRNELSDLRKKSIGFVFQSFNLIPRLTALENVELPLMYSGYSKKLRVEIARKALERVGLGSRLHHRPSQMSGGQQQRTAIARALVLNPSLILADEPTGNLDRQTGEQILDLLCELGEEGHTLVLITHAPSVAAKARRVVELYDGRIIS